MMPRLQEAFGVAVGAGLFAVIFAYGCHYLGGRWTWAVAAATVSWPVLLASDFNASGRYDAVFVPALGSLAAGYALVRWHIEDTRRGGKAREAREHAIGPLEVLGRRVSRHTARRRTTGDDGYVLGVDDRGFPVRVGFSRDQGRHQLFLGASGSGKTNALLLTVCRHIEAGFGAVVVEFKGEHEIGERLRAEAVRRGRPFYYFTLSGGERWNPLGRGSPSELKDKLIAAEEFSERHYEAMYERYLLNLFRALEGRTEPARLDEVIALIDPEELALVVRALEDGEAAEQIARYLERLTEDQRRHLRGLQDRLALLVEGEAGEYLLPGEVPANEIDLLEAIAGGAVVVFSLNASRYPQTAKLIGNLVAQDLKTVCGTLEDEAGRKRPAIVAIDEFSALEADHVAGLFERGRSAGVSLLLSTQEIADLRRVDEGFEDQVLGNVEVLLALRQNVPDSAELVAQMAGTEERWEYTFQTDTRLDARRYWGDESGLGSKRRTEEFVIHPNKIKRLAVGEGVLVTKNPHGARVITVDQESRAAELASEGEGLAA